MNEEIFALANNLSISLCSKIFRLTMDEEETNGGWLHGIAALFESKMSERNITVSEV